MAKALEAVPAPYETLKGKNALIKVKTSVQEALMTELRVGDRFFNNDTDSALVKGKSATEMAGGVATYDSAAWSIENFKGIPLDFRMGTVEEYRRNAGLKISKEQKDSLNSVHPSRPNSNVNFWKKNR